jgi:hypothetical protein
MRLLGRFKAANLTIFGKGLTLSHAGLADPPASSVRGAVKSSAGYLTHP